MVPRRDSSDNHDESSPSKVSGGVAKKSCQSGNATQEKISLPKGFKPRLLSKNRIKKIKQFSDSCQQNSGVGKYMENPWIDALIVYLGEKRHKIRPNDIRFWSEKPEFKQCFEECEYFTTASPTTPNDSGVSGVETEEVQADADKGSKTPGNKVTRKRKRSNFEMLLDSTFSFNTMGSVSKEKQGVQKKHRTKAVPRRDMYPVTRARAKIDEAANNATINEGDSNSNATTIKATPRENPNPTLVHKTAETSSMARPMNRVKEYIRRKKQYQRSGFQEKVDEQLGAQRTTEEDISVCQVIPQPGTSSQINSTPSGITKQDVGRKGKTTVLVENNEEVQEEHDPILIVTIRDNNSSPPDRSDAALQHIKHLQAEVITTLLRLRTYYPGKFDVEDPIKSAELTLSLISKL